MFEPGKVTNILGIDPGAHTGIALVSLERSKVPEPTGLVPNHVILEQSVTTVEEEDLAHTLRAYLVRGREDGLLVACEKFTATRRTLQTQDYQALEAIGALRAIMRLLDIPISSFTLQLPSAAKQVVTDVRLKAMQLGRGSDRHGKDALRHAVFRCVTWVRGEA